MASKNSMELQCPRYRGQCGEFDEKWCPSRWGNCARHLQSPHICPGVPPPRGSRWQVHYAKCEPALRVMPSLFRVSTNGEPASQRACASKWKNVYFFMLTVNPRLSAAALINFNEILAVRRLFKTIASQSITLRESRTRDALKSVI